MWGVRVPSSIHDLVSSLDDIRNKNYLTHGIHPYPAKFIPQIPACLIETYSHHGDLILDPFCGSGTSLLEAFIRGRSSIGIDLNPIATLVAKTKVTILDSTQRKVVMDMLRDLDSVLSVHRLASVYNEVLNSDIPSFLNRDHWFQTNVQRELAWLKKRISAKTKDQAVREYLNSCLSAIVVKVSNQESDTRWKAVNKRIADGLTLSTYKKTLSETLRRTEELRVVVGQQAQGSVRIITALASQASDLIPSHTVDLIVSSPPYLNSYDYYLYHKLRMFWLGYDHKTVQAQEIGSRNRHCDNKEGIESFIQSMTCAMKSFKRVLKPRGICALVVGDAIYQGEPIDSGKMYNVIAKDVGFVLMDEAVYDQRRYSRAFTPNLKLGHKKTHILILRPECHENCQSTQGKPTGRSSPDLPHFKA